MRTRFFSGVAAVIALTGLSRASEAGKPNIIVIYTDDHGYADLGCQGIMKDVKTPNIDALAASGVRMTTGYVTAPQCGPSRSGLISGQYQNRFGMEANGDFEKKPDVLQRFRELKTLPKRLKEAGYVTGMAGKSHLGSDDSADLVALGFDKAFFKHSAAPGSWNMDLMGKDISPQEQNGGDYHLEMITTFACTFINRFKDQPFFFYLAYRAPHVPLDAPQKYLDLFPGPMPEERRKALGAISCIDDGVGRIMGTLRKNGLEENTLIFVISDNGAPLKRLPHSLVAGDDDSPLKLLSPDTPSSDWPSWDGSLNDPLNGEKGMLTEGGIRTPWVVHWLGTIPGGQVYTNPVITLDVAKTATVLAGLPDDPALDGVNLVPYLTGEKKGLPHDVLYWRWLGQSAIRKGEWKYLRSDNREYLFNIQNDPEEAKNLLSAQPEIARSLHADLEKWTKTLAPPGIWAVKSDGMSRAADENYNWYLDGKRVEEKKDAPAANAKGGRKEAAKNGLSDEQLFKQRDQNKDGMVTLEEFIAGRTEKVPQLEEIFKRRDTNGNGFWERNELEQ